MIVFVMYLYNVYEFDRKNLEEKCLKDQNIGTRCDCWYTAEKFDSRYNFGNRNIIDQIPVICKMRNKAYHMLD